MKRALVLIFLSSCLLAPAGKGVITAAWQLQASDGTVVNCASGDTVSIDVQSVAFTFPCAQGSGTTTPIPIGKYNVDFEYVPADGSPPIVVTQAVDVVRNTTTDVGVLVFTTSQPPTGTATITWSLHESSPTAPGEACGPGETILIDINGDAFTVDCYTYGSQPVTNLPPGSYTGTFSLLFNGTIETDPRPGAGQDVVTTTFSVTSGQDTPVHVDFVVAPPSPSRSDAGRSARFGPPAPTH